MYTTLQGAKRPVRIAATMIVVDVAWWQPQLAEQTMCPSHTEHQAVVQQPQAASQSHGSVLPLPQDENTQSFQFPTHQLSAMVLVHLAVDIMQFLHWCMSMLATRRRGERRE